MEKSSGNDGLDGVQAGDRRPSFIKTQIGTSILTHNPLLGRYSTGRV